MSTQNTVWSRRWTLHRNNGCHLVRHRDLIRSLPTFGCSPGSKLRARLEKCGTLQRNGRLYHCGSPACHYCRDRYIGKQIKALLKPYAGMSNDVLSMITVVAGVTEPNCIDQVAGIWKKTCRDTRNLFARARKKSPAWNGVELTAWMEIDVVDDDQMDVLGEEKRKQILELHGSPSFSGRLWIVTFHGIIFFGDKLSLTDVQRTFQRQWPLVSVREWHVGLSNRGFGDSRRVLKPDLEPPCGPRPPVSSIVAAGFVTQPI